MAPNVGLEAKVDDRTEPVLFSRHQTEPLLELLPRRSNTARMQGLYIGQHDLLHERLESAQTVLLDEEQPLVGQLQLLSSSWMPAVTAHTNPLWSTVYGGSTSTTSTTDRRRIVSANMQPQHNVRIQRNSETAQVKATQPNHDYGCKMESTHQSAVNNGSTYNLHQPHQSHRYLNHQPRHQHHRQRKERQSDVDQHIKQSASSLRQNQRTHRRKDRSASTDISDNDDTTYNRHHHQHRHQHRQQHKNQQEHQHHQHHNHGQRRQHKDVSTSTDQRDKRSTSPPSRTQRTHRREDRSPPSNCSDNDSSDSNRRRKKKHHPKRNGDPSPSDSSGEFDGSSSSDESTDRLKDRKCCPAPSLADQ